mmetsp:Transcript_113797/g.332410  ORF Transcript_113797/g.332410 Transcript_113797/m.332410 type:complete len:273 (+) Transcript_113797:336-1154(+)
MPAPRRAPDAVCGLSGRLPAAAGGVDAGRRPAAAVAPAEPAEPLPRGGRRERSESLLAGVECGTGERRRRRLLGPRPPRAGASGPKPLRAPPGARQSQAAALRLRTHGLRRARTTPLVHLARRDHVPRAAAPQRLSRPAADEHHALPRREPCSGVLCQAGGAGPAGASGARAAARREEPDASVAHCLLEAPDMALHALRQARLARHRWRDNQKSRPRLRAGASLGSEGRVGVLGHPGLPGLALQRSDAHRAERGHLSGAVAVCQEHDDQVVG